MLEVTAIKNTLKDYSPEVERNTGDERWYRIKDETKWLPSVTTMIGSVINKGIGFEKWLGSMPSYDLACEKRDAAAEVGTRVHNLCEDLLLGKAVNLDEAEGPSYFKRLMSFVEWYKIHKPTILATELKLVHKDVPYSGTPDIVCIIDEKIHMVDIKTGAPYDTHELQLTCYKELWDKTFPEFKIDEICGLYLKDSWISKVEPMYKKYKYSIDAVNSVYNIWLWQNGGSPKPKTKKPLQTNFKLGGIIDASEQL
tara:strand:- start:5 stop:766 length:762 start_codon:yes stop_codon:yes gene_type:complete